MIKITKTKTKQTNFRCQCCFKFTNCYYYKCDNIKCKYQRISRNNYIICSNCYDYNNDDNYDDDIKSTISVMINKIKLSMNIINNEVYQQISKLSKNSSIIESIKIYMNDVNRYFYIYWILMLKNNTDFGTTNEYQIILNNYHKFYDDILIKISNIIDQIELNINENIIIDKVPAILKTDFENELNSISLQFHVLSEIVQDNYKDIDKIFDQYVCDVNEKCISSERIKFIIDLYQKYFIQKYIIIKDINNNSDDEIQYVDIFMNGLNGYSIIDLLNDFEHVKSIHIKSYDQFKNCTFSDYCCSEYLIRYREISRTDNNDSNSFLTKYLDKLDTSQLNLIEISSKVHTFFIHTINNKLYKDNSNGTNNYKIRGLGQSKKLSRERYNKFMLSVIENKEKDEFELKTDHDKSNSNCNQQTAMDNLFNILNNKNVIDYLQSEEFDSDAIIYDVLDDNDFNNNYLNSNLYIKSNKNKYLMKVIKKHYNLCGRDDDDNIPKFIYGKYRFYHWSYMSKWKTFIKKPKYISLKDECLNNNIYSVSIKNFTDQLNKSFIYINTIKGRSIKSNNYGSYNYKYSIHQIYH